MEIKYRPEIDGLRAIAVVAVILYHAQINIFGFQLFKGGFIGVDIFFVISGYLITSVILKQLLITGTFSFKYFYERRIRRILPALLLVMLVSLPFAWMYLMPSNFVDFSKSILYSLGFTSNFYFHYTGQDYASQSSLLKPFLHTWSLSVEEQYYIVFPIILFVTFKYFKKYILYILVVGLVVSLQLAEIFGKINPSSTFYFLHTRLWELMAGSILAYLENTLGRKSKSKNLNNVLTILGLYLIINSLLIFDDDMFHPSYVSLIPILGVCLVIWFSNKDVLITNILSTKILVGIGLISYSLYLWHYPVFAFSRITEYTQGNFLKYISLILIIFTFSIISYYLVERPARNKNIKFRLILTLILFFIFFLIFYNFNIIQKEGYKNRIPEILNKNLELKTTQLLKNQKGEICFDNRNMCQFNSNSNQKVYLIGDSHMGSLMFDLKKRITNKNFQFITSTYGQCLFVPGFNLIYLKTKKIDPNCNDDYFQKLKKILNNENDSIMIFGGRFQLYFSNSYFDNKEGGIEGGKWENKFNKVGNYDDYMSSFKNELLELSKKNKIILIYPIPETGWNIPSKLLNSLPKDVNLIKDYLVPKNYISSSYDVYINRTKKIFDLFETIEDENIFKIYPHELFCNTIIPKRCITHDSENVFYSDDDHVSVKGSEMINDLIMDQINKIKLLKLN